MSGSSRPRPRPVPGPSPAWRFPAVERHVLANGMNVVACHLPDRPIIDVKLVVDCGSGREDPASAGLTHIVGQGLKDGTELRPTDDFHEAVESLGAQFGVFEHWSGVVPGISVPRDRLIPALELLTEVVVTPGFRDEDLERTIRRRVDQLAMEKMIPQVAAMNAFVAATFAPGTRFSVPQNGTAETLAAIDPSAVRSWWAAYTHPSTATLVIVGDLRGVDLSTLLGKTLEPWVTEAPELPALQPQPALLGRRCSIVDFPQGVQTTLLVGHAFEPFSAEDEAGLTVAMYALGGYFSSRLVTKLREEKGITYGIQAAPDLRRQAASMTIFTSVEQGATEEAVSDILDEVAALSQDLTQEEVGKAADNLIRTGPIAFKTVSRVALQLLVNVLTGRADDHFDRTREQMATLTADEARETFSRYIRPENLVVTAAGPATKISEGLERVVGEVTVTGGGMDPATLAEMVKGMPGLAGVDPATIAAAMAKAQAQMQAQGGGGAPRTG